MGNSSIKDRIINLLTALYEEKQGLETWSTLQESLESFQKKNPQLNGITPLDTLENLDALLITYADQIQSPGQPHLQTLADFAFKYQGIKIWGAAVTSIVYSFIATAFTILVGLIAALLLNRPFKGRGLTRAIFLFPYVAPVVSTAFVWRWILDPRPSGVLNDILMRLNFIDLPIAYLAERGWALVFVILFEGWRYFPFAMLMILARLQAVDTTLYEAAEVDGANTMQKFWNVTIPELRYVLGAVFLLRLMWTFNKFDDIFLLTGGGFGTRVLPILTYEFSFRLFDFGRGAATAMILLIILAVFMTFYIKVVMQNVED